MPRAGLDRTAVVACGAEILDSAGDESLSLAAVAARLGVRTPSLYKHVDGLPGLRRGIALRAKAALEHDLGRAARGRSRDDAIRAIAVAYRRWALAHPGQYPLTVHAPAAGDPDDEAASAALAEVVYVTLAGYELREDDAVDATRFLRSSLHGFVSLETSGAFALPIDLERSFARLVESLVSALATWKRS